MMLLGSGLFIAGMISGGLNWLDHTTLPDSTLMLFLGIGTFLLFFPWFLCLFCCRVLLRAIHNLEQKVETLSHDA
jgi:TRAP-type C4-dicarboxylate transport system permease small subunit